MVKFAGKIETRMAVAFGISLAIFVMEVIGGFLSGSLALLSDAGHVFADAISLSLSWYALNLSHRRTNGRATFGYHRVGIMVALLNGTMLIVMAVLIFREAYERFLAPTQIQTTELLVIASIGLLANLAMAWLLHSGHQHSLNVKSAWLHVLSDSLASLGVIISGVIILFTGWRYADPIASVLIGVLILIGGWRVIREAGAVFLELAPRHLDSNGVLREMRDVPGVLDVHDFHLWMITPQIAALAAHVQVKDQPLSANEGIFIELQRRLQRMGIGHTTLQLECHGCALGETFCHQLEPLEHGKDTDAKPIDKPIGGEKNKR
jgi:cobalt-zinc-cadmium efflux system protein